MTSDGLPFPCVLTSESSRMDPLRFTLLVRTLLKFPLYRADSYRKFLIRHGWSMAPSCLGILQCPGLMTPILPIQLMNEVSPFLLLIRELSRNVRHLGTPTTLELSRPLSRLRLADIRLSLRRLVLPKLMNALPPS